MKGKKFFLLLLLIAPFIGSSRAAVYLLPDTVTLRELRLTAYNSTDSAYTFLTMGTTSYLYTCGLKRALHADELHLFFEYKSSTGVNYLQTYFKQAETTLAGPRISDIPSGDIWQSARFNITDYHTLGKWGEYLNRVYFRVGSRDSAVFSIRNIRLETGPADTLPDPFPDSADRRQSYLDGDYVGFRCYLLPSRPMVGGA